MKTRKAANWYLPVFGMIFLSINCGYDGPMESLSAQTPTNQPGEYKTAVGGNITELNISNGEITVPIDEGTKDGDIVLAVYSYQKSNDNVAIKLDDFSNGADPSTGTSNQFLQKVTLDTEDPVENFNNLLRNRESNLSENEPLPEISSNAFLTRALKIGEEREFKIINSFSVDSYEFVSAELRYQNNYFDVYIDKRDNDIFTDEEINTLAEDFTKILLLERSVFGQESDVNGDGKFVILFSHVINELGQKYGGMITGFFYALDLFDSKKYPFSNEMEIMYAYVPDQDGKFGIPVSKSFTMSSVLPNVFPHEFQHMINFNQHYFVSDGLAELGWLNEGLSHLAEDFSTLNSDSLITGYGSENPSRVSGYLAGVSDICFTCGTTLEQRGGSYLFVKYLYEQAELGNLPGTQDGMDLLKSLVQTDLVGKSNVVAAALGEGLSQDEFKKLIGSFSLALYLSDSGYAQSNQFEFFGFKMRGKVEDYRGTYLQGPSVIEINDFPYTGSIPSTGISYLQVPRTLLNQADGQLSFTVSDDVIERLGAYLIHDN